MKPLHDKKHTLAKRGLSLLCVLALCLGLLPVTALAAGDAPDKLYVGNQVLPVGQDSYWITSTDGKLTKSSDDQSWNVKYEPDTATLTLNGATIQGGTSTGSVTGSVPYGAGIYAQCDRGQPVALIIELIGKNTITAYYGIYVNAEISSDSKGTDASLTITGENNGSLGVSGSNHGIYVKSGSGDASLNIEKSTVTSSTNGDSAAGVYVMSSNYATNSPNISLSVDGGSLTTSGSANGKGIKFYVGSSQATGATTSLTVSENAIVDARNGGISALKISETLPTPTPTGENSSGIVFDGTEGTVYGDVELQNELTIGEGESLTVPEGSSLNCNEKLTNNGTILASGGTVTGNLSGGTAVTTPNITAQPTGQTVTEGSAATFSVTASAGDSETLTYQWQQSTASGSDWTDISQATSASYTTVATTTDMSGYQYRCMVKSASGVGVISSAATLTVQAKPASVPVTDVSLDKGTISLFTGESETLTAMVVPVTATDKSVTWSSDKPEVATVENGEVTAKAAGTATITVTTQDGGKTDTCTVKVTDPVYDMTTDTTALNFGSAYTGYAQPASKTVTVKNTGNQPVTLTQPASTNSFEVGALSTTSLPVNGTATFTVQPKTGLSVGTYSETIEVTGTEGAAVTIPASFTVKSRPSYNPPTVSEETTDAIQAADPGETVTVDLSSGSTKLDKEVFETLAGRDVTLVIDLGDDVSWTVKGSDIPEDATLTDIDMGVTMNSDGIPVNVINTITGEVGTVQITLAHDGAFGFTMTLTAPLGVENAGYWANLYHYDEDAEQLTFETAAEIDADGSVSLPMSHASQYAIVIDTHSHAAVDVSDLFIDIAPDAWYKDAVQYAYDQGLMTGVSATEFDPEATTTRAMIVSILARLEGVTTAEAAGFADVTDEWYATAVNWAANVGVVNGYEDGTFKPNTAITREQLAAILMNYAAYKGYDVSARADLSHYSDADSISSWANDVLLWAVAEGLLTGVTDDTIAPQAHATRAQVAAILQRFLSE